MHMHDIITAQFHRFREQHRQRGMEALNVLEIGTIREDTPEHEQGDGWSTIAFARDAWNNGGHVTSVDLAIETAGRVLARQPELAERVTLWQGYSVEWMAAMLAAGQRFDVILLDSENDPQLTLHEFMLAEKLLVRPGLILVDDVVPGSATIRKGAALLPWLDASRPHHRYTITPRTGNGFTSGVLSVVVP